MLALQGEVDLEVLTQGQLQLGLMLLAFSVVSLPSLGGLMRRFAPLDSDLPRAPWTALEGTGVFAVGALFLSAAPLFSPFGILGALFHMVVLLGAMGILAIALAKRGGSLGGVGALGLWRGAGAKNGCLGGTAYLIFFPVLWGVLLSWPSIAPLFGIEMEPQAVLEHVVSLRGGELVIAGVLAVVVVPFLEELIFRGFLQSVLTRQLGALPGVVLSSVAFALLHGVSASGPIFVLSLFLGWLQLRTGRLTAAWIAHAAHNGLTLAGVLILSGVL